MSTIMKSDGNGASQMARQMKADLHAVYRVAAQVPEGWRLNDRVLPRFDPPSLLSACLSVWPAWLRGDDKEAERQAIIDRAETLLKVKGPAAEKAIEVARMVYPAITRDALRRGKEPALSPRVEMGVRALRMNMEHQHRVDEQARCRALLLRLAVRKLYEKPDNLDLLPALPPIGTPDNFTGDPILCYVRGKEGGGLRTFVLEQWKKSGTWRRHPDEATNKVVKHVFSYMAPPSNKVLGDQTTSKYDINREIVESDLKKRLENEQEIERKRHEERRQIAFEVIGADTVKVYTIDSFLRHHVRDWLKGSEREGDPFILPGTILDMPAVVFLDALRTMTRAGFDEEGRPIMRACCRPVPARTGPQKRAMVCMEIIKAVHWQDEIAINALAPGSGHRLRSRIAWGMEKLGLLQAKGLKYCLPT